MSKIPVAILGATGTVGQRYVALLADHPWFHIELIAASARSTGLSYGEAVMGRWMLPTPIPPAISTRLLEPIDPTNIGSRCQLVFSAVDSQTAKQIEEPLAAAGLGVISNSSCHRFAEDVPLLIPEVNPEHLQLIHTQRLRRGWETGFIVSKPNCSIQSYLIPLAPWHRLFGIETILLTTLQAVSGAGLPGPSALSMLDNIIPYIAGEEEKSEFEPLKMLSPLIGDPAIPSTPPTLGAPPNITLSAHCTRVPLSDGHTACVSVRLRNPATSEELLNAWREFTPAPQQLGLPSAPKQPIRYLVEADRPQPLLDRNCENGMAVSVGRLRRCPVLDYRFVGLSHNTLRGAAGGGVLIAELLTQYRFLI